MQLANAFVALFLWICKPQVCGVLILSLLMIQNSENKCFTSKPKIVAIPKLNRVPANTYSVLAVSVSLKRSKDFGVSGFSRLVKLAHQE